ALALVLFERVQPAIARATKRLDFAVPIEIGRNEVADGRFQRKGPAHFTGMVSVAENFIRRTQWTLLRERFCPVANHFSVSLRGNEFQLAIAIEVPQARLTGVCRVAREAIVPNGFSLQASEQCQSERMTKENPHRPVFAHF